MDERMDVKGIGLLSVSTRKLSSGLGRGFTLIEVMIVVAIIAILSVSAMPLYSEHVGRTQIARVVHELSAMRSPIEYELYMGRTTDGISAFTLTDLGWFSSDLIDGGEPSIDFPASDMGGGELEAIIGGTAAPLVRGMTVSLTRTAQGAWSCQTSGGAGEYSERVIPKACPYSSE